MALCLLLALALPATGAQAATNDLDLVSRASGAAGAKGNNDSFRPLLSADGRFIAFDSVASNLHPDDGDVNSDVFVRDLDTNTNTLVSRATGAGGAKGNATSIVGAVSRDGRFVVFDSSATNLDPADTEAGFDVFVRDLQTTTTSLVSRASGAGGTGANGTSLDSAVSDDGRFVVFTSDASNLHPDDGDVNSDVFVRDLQTTTTTLVSRATGATGAKANAPAQKPRISGDGRFVVFTSDASNLSPADADAMRDVFVRDLQTNTTTLVSRATGASGAKGDGVSLFPVISRNGRFVAFSSGATNLHPADGDARLDVFVRDLQTNTNTLVSRATGAGGVKGNFDSNGATISDDGRFVAFYSAATNLHSADGDAAIDVFLRDLQKSTTTLVSRAAGAAGAKGNSWSDAAMVSGDGRFVAFDSVASNLHPDDGDTTLDSFRRQVRSEPTAAADSYVTEVNTPLTVAAPGVLANDNDADGDPLSALLVSGPAHGTLALSANGSFTYTPAGGYLGPDSFTYKANDGDLESTTATVAIDVDARPSAAADAYLTAANTALTVAAPGVLGNDSDVDGDPLTARLVSGPAHGTLALGADGSFTYTAAGGYFGPDSFTYKASDGALDSTAATVAIEVDARPSAAANAYTTAQGAPLLVAAPGVLGNDRDADGDPLSAVLVSGPAHGTLVLGADGSFRYAPARGYFGQDSFVYRASDGRLDSATARVTIAVRPLCQGLPATIVGTAGRNVLRGTPRADVIVALGGNDLVRGGGGNDRVCAGDGADRIEGGTGADRLAGERGNDLLLGGIGNDLLLGGPGNDTLRGGPGRDTLRGGPGRDLRFP